MLSVVLLEFELSRCRVIYVVAATRKSGVSSV